MSERELTAALDVLVDRCDDEYGDWSDVLGRAGVVLGPGVAGGAVAVMPPPRRGRSARRVGLVALAAVLLAAVAFVSTGFGRDALSSLLGRIDVDFWRSERAPAVVRWRFEDLAIGAPPQIAPQAIPSQARTVGTLRIGGRERTLWVAPTKRGGFCFEVERSWGGCMRDAGAGGRRPPRALPLVSVSPAVSIERGHGTATIARMLGISGVVLSDRIERLTVEFADGETQDLDFVYVSAPIDAGFFGYTVPGERQRGPGRPRFVVARDSSGNVVSRQRLYFPTRLPQPVSPGRSRGPSERTLPARPTPPPSAPLQHGEAHGVSITAGRNGSVLFDATQIAPDRRALLDGGITYACFELVTRGGVTEDRGLGQSARFQPTVGFRLFGVGTPLDGCEIEGGYGHRWPDKLDGHSAIEVPFSEAGRRFFEERAAARDLALFVRTGAMRRLRRTSPPLTAADLRRHFGPRIAALPSRTADPPRGTIGHWVDGSSVLFRRVSSTGRRFEVVVGPGGGIRSENVKPLAFVF